jgi:hypothetical protein
VKLFYEFTNEGFEIVHSLSLFEALKSDGQLVLSLLLGLMVTPVVTA